MPTITPDTENARPGYAAATPTTYPIALNAVSAIPATVVRSMPLASPRAGKSVVRGKPSVRWVVSYKPFATADSRVSDDLSDGATDARTTAVRERVLAAHADFFDAVAAAARVTESTWSADHASSRAAVVEPFERVLEETGTLDAAPRVLASAVDAAGGDLQADPVPSPPYVAITTRGVVLRATTDVGRVVVTVAPFAVERDPVRYVHRGAALRGGNEDDDEDEHEDAIDSMSHEAMLDVRIHD